MAAEAPRLSVILIKAVLAAATPRCSGRDDTVHHRAAGLPRLGFLGGPAAGAAGMVNTRPSPATGTRFEAVRKFLDENRLEEWLPAFRPAGGTDPDDFYDGITAGETANHAVLMRGRAPTRGVHHSSSLATPAKKIEPKAKTTN